MKNIIGKSIVNKNLIIFLNYMGSEKEEAVIKKKNVKRLSSSKTQISYAKLRRIILQLGDLIKELDKIYNGEEEDEEE